MKQLQFDSYLKAADSLLKSNNNYSEGDQVPIFSQTVKNVTYLKDWVGVEDGVQEDNFSAPFDVAPAMLTTLSAVTTFALIYVLTKDLKRKPGSNARSTPLPGYGILGDKVNELIELFLDALAVYVHNDNKWECQRRMLCEANQRAGDYGVAQGLLMYFLSLAVSFLLQNQRVSESLEAMKFGRKGNDCTQLYPKCPFSL